MNFELLFAGKYDSYAHIFEQIKKMEACTEEIFSRGKCYLTGKESFPENKTPISIHLEPIDFSKDLKTSIEKICFFFDTLKKENPNCCPVLYNCYKNAYYYRTSDRAKMHIDDVRKILKRKDGKTIQKSLSSSYGLLKMFHMVYENKKNISILDFGGDVGQHYAALLAKNLKDIELSYTLIDLPSVGHYSNKFWKEEMKDSNISILDSIPFSTLNKIDIAYARSSIQYLKDNPKDYLKRITNMSPKYIGFFENYMSKEDPTYLTTQRYSTGYLIPYWMYNQNDIISFMEKNGYKKVFYAEKKCEHYWQLNKEKRNSDRYLTDFIFERLER